MKDEAAPGNEPVTRVLMNPPFALRDSVEKEYRFVSRALELMADGALLFSLLPLDAMFGARDERVWRRDELLKKHTLLSVVSLPHELFVPAALKQVVGVVIKKGAPHPKTQPVFWARVENDGLAVLKKSGCREKICDLQRMSQTTFQKYCLHFVALLLTRDRSVSMSRCLAKPPRSISATLC